LIAPENAAGLFPSIAPGPTPNPTPSPAPDQLSQAAGRGASPASRAADLAAAASGMPVVTAQVLGLIALAFAVMLTITRLSVRRRRGR
jgi:hypothetical protein